MRLKRRKEEIILIDLTIHSSRDRIQRNKDNNITRASRKDIGKNNMIKFSERRNIYLYSENIDMRMGMNKIQILVASNFTSIEIRHSVFVFCSNNGKTIKLYYEDDYGS